MNKKNKITIPFSIDAGNKLTLGPQGQGELNKFKAEHPGKSGEMVLEIADGPKHKQHREYRAYILPAIFEKSGEPDINYFHEFVLKAKYKTFTVRSYEEIPQKYLRGKKKGRFTEKQKVNEKGEIIDRWIEYVPSCSAFSEEEMEEYIQNCKVLLDGLESSGSIEEIKERMGNLC